MRRLTFAFVVLLLAGVPGTLSAQEEQAAEPAQTDTLFPEAPFSAGGAFWRSVVIPGWAQAELGAESRGAFYFLAEAFSIFMVARSQIRLSHAQRTLSNDNPVTISRRQQREDWAALAVFWALFAGADGWVSVHLYGFDERTGVGPDDVAIGIGWKIPFGP
jgi:hypothetical protein